MLRHAACARRCVRAGASGCGGQGYAVKAATSRSSKFWGSNAVSL